MQSSSRNGATVRVLAVHTTEGIMRAEALRAWTTWSGSAHASADETGVLLAGAEDGFVDYSRASWTLRNGNPWSENIELCGFAKWKRADWLARPKLLDRCAFWLASRAVVRGIPLVKLSPKELAAGKRGVIGHHDYTVGYSDGTHWDPGPEFPYDVVLGKANEYAAGKQPKPDTGGFLMALTDAEQREILDRLRGDTSRGYDMLQSIEALAKDVQYRVRGTHPAMDALQVIQWQLSNLDAAPDVDGDALAAAVVAAIPDDIAEQVAEKLADRLAS